MARTYSWLPRLAEIRKAAAGSTRSHWSRAQLQDLFQIQQSPATRLMDVMPTVKMNVGLFVEREALLAFLDKVREVEDVPKLMGELKAAKNAPTRRNLRSLVQRDVGPVGFEGMPANLALERGRMSIQFDTLDQLVETEFFNARLIQDHLEEYARRFEPIKDVKPNADADEVKRMFAELTTAV